MNAITKSIERAVRRAVLLTLSGGTRADNLGASITLPEAPRILLLRHDRIGDALISTPIIAMLRERFPSARIDMLLGAKNRAVRDLIPSIDHAVVMPTEIRGALGTIRRLRRERYDLCINLLTKDSASGALITRLTGARTTIGFAGDGSGSYHSAVPRSQSPMHIVRETSLLLVPLGIAPIGPAPTRPAERLHIVPLSHGALPRFNGPSAEERIPMIVVNISASDSSKFWGAENYALLAQRLAAAGLRPVIASGPADEATGTEIADRAGCARLPVTPSFAEFADRLSEADMIVTPDTSIVHLAAALGRPTVTLSQSASVAEVWGPWGVPTRAVVARASVSSIPVDEVVRAIIALALETATSSIR